MNSKEEEFKALKYSSVIGKDFESTLRTRVRTYFKETNTSIYGNKEMKIKTGVILCLYFIPYLIIMFGVVKTPLLITFMYAIMGFGMSGIGMCIIHDANHGSYSKNKTVNFVLGRILNIVGAYAPTWKIQHNILHHTYTNIHDFDEDVSPAVSLIRLSPNDTHRPVHRFQFIYAWFFYSLMTVLWITTKDVSQIFRYKKMGLTKGQNFKHLLIELALSKLVYYSYMIILPLFFLNIPWWSVLLLLLLKHVIAGFTLAIVFLLAHVVPETTYPLPDKDLTIKNNWAIHQLETTANFAPNSRFFSWFIGGLNYQIEHHLFPNICHVHYKSIAQIVKQTASEFNIPYHSEKTFLGAILNHAKMLKQLGNI